MAAQERLLCTHCLLPFGGTWGTNFIGLRKWLCPRCRHENVWPMTIARETVYWVLLAAFTVIFVYVAFVLRTTPMPGVLFVLLIVAHALNYGAKQRLKEALARERQPLAAHPPPDQNRMS